jgi:hypothetical protein
MKVNPLQVPLQATPVNRWFAEPAASENVGGVSPSLITTPIPPWDPRYRRYCQENPLECLGGTGPTFPYPNI